MPENVRNSVPDAGQASSVRYTYAVQSRASVPQAAPTGTDRVPDGVGAWPPAFPSIPNEATTTMDLALRPAPAPLQAPASTQLPPDLALADAPLPAAEPVTVRTLAKPIKRMPLSERMASHPAYVGLWEAIRTNDAKACKAHLKTLEDLGPDVLYHTLTHEVLDLGAFASEHAPEGSALVKGQQLPPAEACDAYALIVDRARPYDAEEASTKMGPGRPASIAAALGHADVLEAMLKHDVNVCNLSEVVASEGQAPLHTTPAFWAAYFGHADCLRLLQKYGVAVSAVRSAITHKAQPETVKWLGADKNDRLARSAFEDAMAAAIMRASDEPLRASALEDIRTLITHGKLSLDKPCDSAPQGWVKVALRPQHPLQRPAYEAAELMLRAGAPLEPLGGDNLDFLQLALRSGEQSLIATFLEMNAAIRKNYLPGLGRPAPLQVVQKHFMAAIDSEAPQQTLAQLLMGGYAPKTSVETLRLYEAAYQLEQTRITEVLQIEYRLLRDREGRAFAHLSTHRAMDPEAFADYQSRRAKLLEQCRRDEVALDFDQKFSGDAHYDLNADLDTPPVHAWWGLRPVYNGAKTFGVATLDFAALTVARCCCCCK